MAQPEVIAMVKKMLMITDSDADDTIATMLDIANDAILDRLYCVSGRPEGTDTIPRDCMPILVNSVVISFSQVGAEGELLHNEDGVSRTYNYSNMLEYINRHVIPFVGGLYHAST